ncbi:hypothetical protein KJ557_01255 [Patescibacteria group bacterium]|nr:hypothetical protein [Patescibacteria group bacterium]
MKQNKILAAVNAGLAAVNAFFIPSPFNVAVVVFCGLAAIILAMPSEK